MTGPDGAGDWRDLSRELTPDQIAELERTEKSWERIAETPPGYLSRTTAPPDDRRRQLLSWARQGVKRNKLKEKLDQLARLAAPPDISYLQPWDEQHQENGVWFRAFGGGAWPVEWHQVTIEGRQYEDGRCERAVYLRAQPPDEILRSRRVRSAELPRSGPPLTHSQIKVRTERSGRER